MISLLVRGAVSPFSVTLPSKLFCHFVFAQWIGPPNRSFASNKKQDTKEIEIGEFRELSEKLTRHKALPVRSSSSVVFREASRSGSAARLLCLARPDAITIVVVHLSNLDYSVHALLARMRKDGEAGELTERSCMLRWKSELRSE
ncbi:hypothetical protein KCU61_g97, partial [Aureobasidium melanogenum]